MLLRYKSAAALRSQARQPTPRARILSRQISRSSHYRRYISSKSLVDEKIDAIQEQYATTKDEFEIAVEETEKKTVYAAEDRAVAQEELKKLKAILNEAVTSAPADVATEIRSRVGQRVRELDHAIQGLEESAKND